MLGFHTRSLIITIILVILAALGGFLGSTLYSGNQASEAGGAKAARTMKLSPLFDTQTAIINGEVEKVDGDKVTIRKKDLTDTFSISPQATIYQNGSVPPQASSSSNLKSIETGKNAQIMLQVVDNEYRIISIFY